MLIFPLKKELIEIVDGKDTDKPVYAIHLGNVKEVEE